MISKLITKLAREATKKAKEQHKAKIKSIKAGKGTANEKFKKMDKANDILLKKLKQAKIKDAKDARKAEAFKKAQRTMKKKPAVRVSPGGKGKSAPAKPIGKMGLRKRRMTKQEQFDKAEEEFERTRLLQKVDPSRMGRQKGGITMPMHGKKKSKMMARGGMKKKSKMMARGGMKKKSKMMARGGMKKTKSYARGGAARRR